MTVVISSGPQSRKANETDKDKKGLEARADSIGSGRAIPIKQVRLPVGVGATRVSCGRPWLTVKITHLTSITGRGSPRACEQIIRRRERDLTVTPSIALFFLYSSPRFFFLFFFLSPPSVRPLQAARFAFRPASFFFSGLCLPECFDGNVCKRRFRGNERRRGREPRMKGTASKEGERFHNLTRAHTHTHASAAMVSTWIGS